MGKKKCSLCQEYKILEEFHFQNKEQGKRICYCKKCHSYKQKQYRQKNIEEIRRKEREYAQNNKELLKLKRREYRKTNKEKVRNTELKRRYGITQDDYLDMKEKQNHRCKICKTHEKDLKRILCVDHCHDTGKVRGLLCDTCNKFLGFYEKRYKECEKYLQENK